MEVRYKIDVGVVGTLAMFGHRIIRPKARQVEDEFTNALRERLKKVEVCQAL